MFRDLWGYHLLLQPSITLSLCYNHLTNGLELLMKTDSKCVPRGEGIVAQKCFYGIWASCLHSPTSSQHLLPSHQTPAFLYHGPPCFKAFSRFQVTLAKVPEKLGSPFSCLILSHPSIQYGMNFRQYALPVYKNDTTGTFSSYSLEILKNIARLKNIFST